nr:hypothetical protein [Tanacetum cinerariifolium]
MELVNAARSFSLYLSAEDNASFIKSSSSEMSSLAIHKRLIAPQDISPNYKDVLATQVNRPVKKMKERPKKIEFGQVATEQLNEPNKKKRKVQKKIKCGPIVKNEVTEQLESCIRETIKGSDIKLVIQKLLYMSDLRKSQNRLIAPQDISPNYKDVLATQVNRPMKKRKERPKKIEFGQVATEQLNEPNQKKRKVQKKIKCGPIVKNETSNYALRLLLSRVPRPVA